MSKFTLLFILNSEVSVIKHTTLLSGNIKKALVSLALPLLAGTLLQQLYNTADVLIVGRFLGVNAFAAVGVAGSVMNLFLFALNGFCAGLAMIFAQFYGAGNNAAFRREVFVSLSVGSIVTALLGGLSLFALPTLLRLTQTPPSLIAPVTSYLTIILVGLFSCYFYNLFSGILRALGNTRAALVFLMLCVTLNVLLDWLFVAVFAFGIAGAALATVLAQAVCAVCCAAYFFKHYRFLCCRRTDMGIYPALVKQTLKFGVSFAIHQASLYIGKLLVQGAVNTLGTQGIAAYTAVGRIEGFANSFGDSGGQALSLFVSQNYGAGNRQRVREGLRQGLLLQWGLGLLFSVLLFVTAVPGMQFFLSSGDAQALHSGSGYLKLIALFYLLCFTGNTFLGYFRGIGKVLVPIGGTVLQMAVRCTFSYLWVGAWGLPAVAAATAAGWVIIVLYQVVVYRLLRRKANNTTSSTA